MPDFSKAKVGDRVYSINSGWGRIEKTDASNGKDRLIVVEFPQCRLVSYDLSGRYDSNDITAELYWDVPEISDPPQPRRWIKKSGWINVYSEANLHGKIYETKEEADAWEAPGRTACVYIEWKEEEK